MHFGFKKYPGRWLPYSVTLSRTYTVALDDWNIIDGNAGLFIRLAILVWSFESSSFIFITRRVGHKKHPAWQKQLAQLRFDERNCWWLQRKYPEIVVKEKTPDEINWSQSQSIRAFSKVENSCAHMRSKNDCSHGNYQLSVAVTSIVLLLLC